MVVQTQSWDSDLDWLTKTKEMEPQKEKVCWKIKCALVQLKKVSLPMDALLFTRF